MHFTGQTTENLSRIELLAWVNRSLLAEFKKVEELCTGAAYCQLMDILFPGCLPLARVKYCTNVEHDFLSNLRLFQNALVKLKVTKTVPIDRLAKGRFQDNFEFLQWFKKFYDANYDGKEYDPRAARNNAPMGYGTPSTLRPSQRINTGSINSLTMESTTGGHAGKRAGETNGSQARLQTVAKNATKNSKGEGDRPHAERNRSPADVVATMFAEIDELTIKIQNVEMSREFYYQKLLLIENIINENPEDGQDLFCEKVKEIMYANE